MKRLLALGVLLVASSVHAQDADSLRHLAPYLADDAVLIGRLDLKNVDVDQIAARVAKMGVASAQIDALKTQLAQMRQQLLDAGAKHVFVTNVGKPLDFDFVGVIPATDPQAVVRAIPNESPTKTHVVGNVVLVGTPKSLDAAAKVVSRPSPEWAKALAKLDASPSFVAVLPPRALLRVFVELQPDLPKELGGGPVQPVVDGLRWVSLGVDLSAKSSVELTLQLADEAAAKNVEPLLERGLALIKNSREAREMPALGKLLDEHRPKRAGDRFVLALDAAAVDGILVPTAGKMRQAAAVAQSMNNLRQLAIAMHVHHDTEKSFPPQATVDKTNRPLLSWRVQILPYIEQKALYDAFHHDEPWDSEHNKKLIAKMPKVYFSPFSKTKPEEGLTTYVVPSGPKAAFNGAVRKRIRDITDGTSNTIMILDVDDSKAVVWTRPEDYPVDPKKANVGHFRAGAGKILAAFFDGSVQQLSGQTPDETLWLYFCPNDGQVIPQEK